MARPLASSEELAESPPVDPNTCLAGKCFHEIVVFLTGAGGPRLADADLSIFEDSVTTRVGVQIVSRIQTLQHQMLDVADMTAV